MTPEQQRIAISEACEMSPVWHEHMGTPQPSAYWHINNVADYPNDLNAMHEAEKTLTQPQWPFYHEWLVKLWSINSRPDYAYETHAGAACRAEAFLRTIGKWVD